MYRYAVREGPLLAENILSYVRGKKLKKYKPQTGFLALLATGDEGAILSWKVCVVCMLWVVN